MTATIAPRRITVRLRENVFCCTCSTRAVATVIVSPFWVKRSRVMVVDCDTARVMLSRDTRRIMPSISRILSPSFCFTALVPSAVKMMVPSPREGITPVATGT